MLFNSPSIFQKVMDCYKMHGRFVLLAVGENCKKLLMKCGFD
jgi:hypothetical protein